MDRLFVQRFSDAVTILRHFFAVVNASDADNSELVEDESNKYANRAALSARPVSANILLRYRFTNTAAKFGQCRVFVSVLISTLRTSGFPNIYLSQASYLHMRVRERINASSNISIPATGNHNQAVFWKSFPVFVLEIMRGLNL